MTALFYRILTFLSKYLGTWFFALISRGIATGYFLFSSRRRATGVRFYSKLFPQHSAGHHIFYTWKQFLNFTNVYMDRFILREWGNIQYTFDGLKYLKAAQDKKQGVILLMSHMGNWEVAAHLLKKSLPDLRLLLYMGIRHKEEIESIQKEHVGQDGIKIVGVNENGGSPFDIVDGIRFLREGGLVSMAGDIVWKNEQRTVTATLLGHQVQLPEAPYILSLVSDAPLIVFFAFRTGNREYRFTALPPIPVTAPTRTDRTAAIHNAAQAYIGHLERALKQHPFEWFHFEQFLGEKVKKMGD